MNDKLALDLRLERDVALRGESVLFQVGVRNVTKTPLAQALTLAKDNQALRLEAKGPAGTFQAHQKSRDDREGLYEHEPREPEVTDLAPGAALSLRDDLLTWFGELPPGTYEVTATYVGAGEPAACRPQALTILPCDPLALDAPRHGGRLAGAPLTAAAVVQFPREGPDANRIGVFWQQQSQAHPKSPIHSVRTLVLKEPITPLAATCVANTDVGHLVWSDKRSLLVAQIDAMKPMPATPKSVPVPYRGQPEASPLTTRQGALHIPFRSETGAEACVISIGKDGLVTTTPLPLGAFAPIGPHAFVWHNDWRLHAAWARPRGRELAFTRLQLDDLAAGWITPASVPMDGSIVWLEGYLDADAPLERRLPDADTPPPDAVVWALLEQKDAYDCVRVNLTVRQPERKWSFKAPGGGMRMVSATITKTHEFAFLLQDGAGVLHYGSTATQQLRPLNDVAGVPIDLQCFPGLLAAGESGVVPWVFVRYLDRKNRKVAFARLEPAGEHDPMDGPVPQAVERDDDDQPR